MKPRETQLRIAAERALKACGPVVADAERMLDEAYAALGAPSPHVPELAEAKGALFALAQALEAK